MKKILLLIVGLIVASPAFSDWKSTPTAGDVEYVRSYPLGMDGLRAEIRVSGVSHDCGTQPNIFYFDTGKVNIDAVRSIMSLAFGAMVSGKKVVITYDCSLHSSGFGWGTGVRVNK